MEPKTIVVVDDEPDMASYLKTVLKDGGYRVYTADNGRDGIETILDLKPDLVAMDVREALQSAQYDVLGVVSSGPEAIRKASETKPDLVLMDIRLKGEMDGVQAARQIRENLDIPVIYLTAYSDESTLARAKVT